MPSNLENSAVATGLEKVSFHSNIKLAKECSNNLTLVLISHASRVMLKILQAREGNGNPLQYSYLENLMGRGAWSAAFHGVSKSRTRLSNFTFTFHFHALEKEMATYSGVFAWRIPGTGEPFGLLSTGSHRVRHDWSKLAAPAAADFNNMWTENFQMFKLDLEKAEESEIKFPTSVGWSKKAMNSRKTPASGLLTMPKPWTVWITINCRKFSKRWEY